MHKHHTGWMFLVCVVLLAGACSDDGPVSEPETKAATASRQQPLPVREWYPTPKHAKPRIAIAPAQIPMNQQPSFNTAPVHQQQWNMQPQPYVYSQPVQPPTQWGGAVQHGQAPVQQPAMPQQYQYVNPYQYGQRPWGSVPNNGQQGTTTDYWNTPAYGSGQYNVYPAPGMPGYVW